MRRQRPAGTSRQLVSGQTVRDASAATARGRHGNGGRPFLSLLPLFSLAFAAACTTLPPDSTRYACRHGGTLTIERVDDDAVFDFQGRRYRLPRVESARGERWRSGDTLLWIRGEEATLSFGDQVVAWGCTPRP